MPADFYTYNSPNSIERLGIESFLLEAEDHLTRDISLTPKDVVDARNVIRWLRSKLDLKPSQMRGTQP